MPTPTGHPVADATAYLLALFAAFGLLYRFLWPVVRAGYRLARGTERLVEDWRESGGLAAIHDRLERVEILATSSHRELHPNGGSSLRDDLISTRDGVRGLADKADRLEGYAAANRDGIARLDTRVTDIDEKADALGERITNHRRRNDEQAALLRERLDRELAERQRALDDERLANEALRASVAELLSIAPPDHRPDLD